MGVKIQERESCKIVIKCLNLNHALRDGPAQVGVGEGQLCQGGLGGDHLLAGTVWAGR